MDFSRLLTRVKNILLTPKTEWPVIAAEPATTGGIYLGYVLVLAAIPAICQYLKLTVFGYSVPFLGTMHIGAGFALKRTACRRSRWWHIRTPLPASRGSPFCCRTSAS